MSDRGGVTFKLRLLWLAYGISGAAALAYEVVWSRHLQLVLGSSVYAVAATLAAMMAGLALGGWLAGRHGDRLARPGRLVVVLELGIALGALLSFPLLNLLPEWHLVIYRRFLLQPAVYFFFDVVLCLPVVLLPTTLMGATFPLVARLATECGASTVTRAAGSVYAANTLGAIAGSVLAGFVFIPLWGLWGALTVAASGNVVAAVLIMVAVRGRSAAAVAAGVALPLAFFAGTAARPPTVPLGYHVASRMLDDPDFRQRLEEMEVVFERWTAAGVVQVREDLRGVKVLIVDGRIEGASRSAERRTQDFLALLPSALRGALDRVFIIGLGTGRTAQTLRGLQRSANITVAEVNPAVIEAVAHHFVPGIGAVTIPSEGRLALAAAEQRFDTIISGPSFPVDGTSANLFTSEFFALASRQLLPGGLVISWVPGYLLDESELVALLAGVARHFQQVGVWRVGSRHDLVLAASDAVLPFDDVPGRLAKLDEPYWQLGAVQLLLAPEEVRQRVAAVSASVRLHRDLDPWLELAMAKSLVRGARWRGL